jgi:hypothetical protein
MRLALLPWITAALMRQLKFAFVFAFNVTPPVACLHPARATS